MTRGVLLCNLGTPQAPTPGAVRKYLAEFLHDYRVIPLTRWLWCPILHGIILRIRPHNTAKLYKKIWLKAGSPLFVHTQAIATALQAHLGDRYKVLIGMRYGQPSITQGLGDLSDCESITVLPLYPQYAEASTASIRDKTGTEHEFIEDYHDHPLYIQAIGEQIKAHWAEKNRQAYVVFSYHGLPDLPNNQAYKQQCRRTTLLVADYLGLSKEQVQTCFQSRFGPKKWLTPYTDKTLETLPRQGIKTVDIIAPGFAADCLETLEEIAIQNQKIFIDAGGEDYEYIPALNASPAQIELLAALLRFVNA